MKRMEGIKLNAYVWIMLLCYPCSMYGLKAVPYELGAAIMVLPMIAALASFPLWFISELLFGKERTDMDALVYFTFVFLTFALLFYCSDTDFMIGRMIMLLGGSMFYYARRIDDVKANNRP